MNRGRPFRLISPWNRPLPPDSFHIGQGSVKTLACVRVILDRFIEAFRRLSQLAAYAMGLQVSADGAVIVAKKIFADIFEKVKMADIVRYGWEDLLDGMQDRSAHVVYQRNGVAVRLLNFLPLQQNLWVPSGSGRAPSA